MKHSLRHDKLSIKNNLDRLDRLSSSSTNTILNPYPNYSKYHPLVSTIPSGSLNASVDSSIYIVDNSSIKLTNGYIDLNSITFNSNLFCIEFWFYLTQNVSTLFSISNSFNLLYNKNTNNFQIQRVIYSTNTYESFSIPKTLNLNTWYYLSLVRVNNKLELYINLELVDELENWYYKIKDGDAFLGNSTFNGNFSNFIFSQTPKNTYLYKSKNLNTTKITYSDTLENSKYKLIHLKHTDLIGNASVLGKQNDGTNYKADLSYWEIFPSLYIPQDNLIANGLLVKLLKSQRLNEDYSLDLTFRLSDLDNNVIIFSHWFSNGNQSFYFRYLRLTNEISFTYKNTSNVLNTVIVASYDNTDWNNLVLQEKNEYIDIYYNGVRKQHINASIRHQYSTKYQFNINVNNINTTTKLLVKEFVVFSKAQYSNEYIPFDKDLTKLNPVRVALPKLDHYYSNELLYPGKVYPDFEVTGNFNPNVGTGYTYTITQPLLSFDVNYVLKLELFEYDDLTLSDVSLSATTRTITKNTITATFNINISNYAINPFKDRFKLIVSNYAVTKEYVFSINDSRVLPVNFLTEFRSYVDGYLADSSSVSGTIPNLSGTRNGTTTAVLDSGSIYGKEYLIDAVSKRINLPVTLENIYTVIYLYRELTVSVNRTYVGNSNTYTFNGGELLETVGSLKLNGSASDYITAIEQLNIIASKVYISKNNTTFLTVNDTNSTVSVYRKLNSGVWNTTPVQLNTNITDVNGVDVHISNNGDYIAIGYKNSYNGEGRLQLWKRSGTNWIKDLDMASPIPIANLTAFGHRVRVSNSGTRLFVSELGSNTVYIFNKTTIWSNDPDEAIVGANKFGYDIDINAEGTALAITELDTTTTYLYKFNTTWMLENTWNEGILVKLHSTSDKVLISDYLTSSVKLHTKNTTWGLTESFTSSNDNFGYAIDLLDNDDVLILDLDASRVRLYDASDSYNLLVSFDGGLSITDSIYTFSASNDSVLFSNYANIVRLVTSDGSSLPQNIFFARKGFVNIPISEQLGGDLNILVFSSNTPLSINQIGGSSFTNLGINGLWLGSLFFSSVLTIPEIESLESFLIKYLRLDKYSLYIN